MENGNRSDRSLEFQVRWESWLQPGEVVPNIGPEDLLSLPDILPMLGIVGLDFEDRRLPVIFAGSEIRRYLGFELAGEDFTHLNMFASPDASWERRKAYFDLPCGYHEIVSGHTADFGDYLFAVTLLPILGEGRSKRLLAFVEAQEPLGSRIAAGEMTGHAIARHPIDLGAGVPR